MIVELAARNDVRGRRSGEQLAAHELERLVDAPSTRRELEAEADFEPMCAFALLGKVLGESAAAQQGRLASEGRCGNELPQTGDFFQLQFRFREALDADDSVREQVEINRGVLPWFCKARVNFLLTEERMKDEHSG